MKKGFTLVELSIVLVIIGLLIGGILVAQSLIDSVRIGKFARNLQQYEVAVNLFKLNYKYYPGDSPSFTPPGNGDYVLGQGANGLNLCAAAPSSALGNREDYQFWAHLTESEMMKADYRTYSPTGCGGSDDGVSGYGIRQLSGIIWPYTENKDNNDKSPIRAYRFTLSSNLYLSMYNLYWLDVLALERKLGAQSYDGSNKQLGLVNRHGIGQCWSASLTAATACAEPSSGDEILGELLLFLD